MCVLRVAVAWSDVSVFFLRDGEDCARSSGAALRCLPFLKGTIRAQSRVASSSSGTLVCGSRTTLWLRMRHRDDSSPPVSCTHVLTAWLVSTAKAVSSSRSSAGLTSPRESFVCEEALTSRADCLRTHAGLEPVGRTPKSGVTRGCEPITPAHRDL